MKQFPTILPLLLAAGLLAGCGGAAVPHAQAAESRASLRAAEELGANDVPKGALYLKHARDQIDESERLLKQGDNEKAAMVLRRAEADAELALAHAKAESARQQAAEAQGRIRELEQRQVSTGGST